MTSAQQRAAARTVGLWLNRPRGTRRVPTADEAYAAGRALLEHLGADVPERLTAHGLRAALDEAGVRL